MIEIMRDRLYVLYVIAVFSLSVLAGCAGSIDYGELGQLVRTRKCPVAVDYVHGRESAYGSNQRLLYYLDAAMVNMVCGRYDESNGYLHSAEALADKLWTKSISKEAASFLLNDYTIPYAGEDFERALINLFSAINYVMLGQYDEALVECRRLDANLAVYNQKYEKKNVYKEDAFGRYLSGIIYEAVGSLDDAFIDYYRAYQVFLDYRRNYGTPVPSILVEDLVRLARRTGREDEVRVLIGDTTASTDRSLPETGREGKIVLIHFNGRAPVKKDNRIHIPTPNGPVTIAFPTFEVIQPACGGATVVAESADTRTVSTAALVEDIKRIAVKNLDDRKGRLVAKEIARVAAKQGAIELATKGIRDSQTRRLVKIFANVVNTAIERADTRSWRTLPAEVYLTRVFVPAGTYRVAVRTCGRESVLAPSLEVGPGETKFLFHETMY